MQISPEYREQNRLLHEQREDYGISGARWADYIGRLMDSERFRTALDFGSGKGTLAKAIGERFPIAEYDPAIPGKDAAPEPAELVICTDVLEHIEPVHLNAVLRELARLSERRLFFNIALCEASKTLPDGRNTHLIVKSATWWRERLERYFYIATWQDRGNMVFGEAIPRRLLPAKTIPDQRIRRPVRKEWDQIIAMLEQQSNVYADAWGRIETFGIWEGIGDVRADCQCVFGLLEHMVDPHREMRHICQHALKAVFIMLKVDAGRGEEFWKKVCGQYLRIASSMVNDQGVLTIYGAPSIGVGGVTAVGALKPEDRWANVEAAIKRFPDRIETGPASGRTALLACYGPSLASAIDKIERGENEDVISVSGAHDFLLSHGVFPDYHVECDPRPHKALNIERGFPEVEYLLASCVHPDLFARVEGQRVRLWHIADSDHIEKFSAIGESPQHIIGGGGSVGLRSIPLLYAMGYRDFSIFGMDCSFADEGQTQWAGKHAGKRQDLCEVMCGDRKFISSPVLLTYATGFMELVQQRQDIVIRVYGDGLLQAMLRMYYGVPQVAHAAAADEVKNA